MKMFNLNQLKFVVILFLTVLSVRLTGQSPIWEENFDGTTINKDVWTYDVGGSGMGNGELQNYTDRPVNSYIDNGNLVIQALRENYGGNQFTSARLKTHGRFSFKYGTIEARIKLPNLKNGLWPAFWMMGNNIGQVGWPKCGEFDILEAGSESARLQDSINKKMSGAVHWWHESGTWGTWLQADASAECRIKTGNFYDDYHTFKMVWDNTHIELWLDNVRYFNMPITDPNMSEFHQPNFVLLNLAVGGKNYVNITDPAQITAPLPAKMYVDYIRVYPIAGQTEVYTNISTKKSGNYGVFSESSTLTDKVNYTNDGHIYVWNNMPTGSGATYEGSEVMNYNIAAGAWWGMGIFVDNIKNMSKYTDGYLRFMMKTTTTNKITVGVASASGEGWLDLINGGDQFGLVRDGAWHEVKIPLNRLGVDFNTIYQMFMIKGDAPATAFTLSIDDMYWMESVARPTPENGNFGVFTDNTPCVLKFNTPADGNFYIWSSTLNTTTTTPKEGSNVLSFASAAGQTWFGAAFTPNIKYNLTAFRYSNSYLHFDMKSSSTTTFQIGMKSGTIADVGQKWITFQNGADPYGFARDGQWHSIDIPMSAFDNVDLSQVSQLFELLGTAGAINDIAIDNIYFTGGGTAIKDGTIINVTGVALAPTTLTLAAGSTSQLTATVAPSNATNKAVSWTSSNTAVATVNSTGLVTAVAAGTATITVTTQDGNKTATCSVTVRIPVTGVTLSPTTLSLAVGNTSQLTATVAPSNATNKAVSWTSSNTAVATVNATGLVTAIAVGSATITVTTQDGAKTATCAVTVSNPTVPVTGVTVSPTTASIGVGGTAQLTATVAPSNATNKNVSWSSNNTAVATVNASGLITGISAGSATITVTTQEGAKTATCAVTVSSNVNIALNKPVTVTSIENAGTPGSAAVDGNAGTRWSSAHSDPQSITIDLQASYNINKVVLNWETAAGKNYAIQVSPDGSTNWSTIYSTTSGAAGTITLNITGTGRYIRMSGTTRTTVWGYSLWEFEVYGTPATNIPVTGVTMSPTTASVVAGSTTQLTATVAPSNATNKTVNWTSSNTAVATVNASGVVTGVAAGSATITVTTQDGNKTATCAVTVTSPNVPVTGVTMSPTTLALATGSTGQLTATVAPSNATNKTVSWTSSNTAIATVNASGLVTAVAVGNVTITVTTQDGSKKATCAVTVSNPTTNIALNKPATTSSVEAGFVATNANDGNTVTRWASLFTDPQWIMIDLQNTYSISRVVLNWETASGKNYTIQVSTDNANWTTVATVTNGTVGANINTINLTNATGRYIRMYGTARNTQWGYSLHEFEVYGVATKSADSFESEELNNEISFNYYPNPVENVLNIEMTSGAFSQLSVFDMTGRIVSQTNISDDSEVVSVEMGGLKSGLYVVRLTGTNSKSFIVSKR